MSDKKRFTITQDQFFADLQKEREELHNLGTGRIEGPYPFERAIVYNNGVVVWGFCSIHPGAQLGEGVVVGAFTNICGPVSIGEGTRMQGFNFVPEGISIGKRCFVGPGAMFLNMKYPNVRVGSRSYGQYYDKTVVENEVSIGGAAIIGPGVHIGERAFIAAGALVTSDVKPNWLVKGFPARHIRLRDEIRKD